MKITKQHLKRIIREAIGSYGPGEYYQRRADEKAKVQDELANAREELAGMEPGSPEYRAQFDVVQNLERDELYVGYTGD